MKLKTLFLISFLTGVVHVARAQEMYPVWANTLGGPGWDIAKTICVDPLGDVAITGTFTDSININDQTFYSNGDDDIYVASYSGNGEPLGAFTFGGEAPEIPVFSVYDDNMVLLVRFYRPFMVQGRQIDSINVVNYLLGWFGNDGKLIDHQVIGGDKSLQISGMETDHQGTVYLSGWYAKTLNDGNRTYNAEMGEQTFLLSIYKKAKNHSIDQWCSSNFGRIGQFTIAKNNKRYVTGIHTDTLNSEDSKILYQHLFTAEINKNGKVSNKLTLIKGVEIEPVSVEELKGDIWVAARYKHHYIVGMDTTFAKGQNDIVMMKIPAKKEESQIWSVGGYANDLPLNLSISGEQGVLAGLYADTIWFSENNYQVSEKWGSDLFIAVYNNEKTPVKSLSLGGAYNDFPCAVVTSDAGIYVLGQFKNTFAAGATKYETQGSYDVFVTRFENCGAKDAVTIDAVSQAKADGSAEYTLTAQTGYRTYQWNNNLGFGQTINVSAKGSYTVTATDQYGCACKGTIDLTQEKSTLVASGGGSSDKNKTLLTFRLYPTFTKDLVYWQTGSNFPVDGATLKVYDASGRTLLTKSIAGTIQPTETQTIEMGSFTSGQYLIEVLGNGYNEIVKVIVK